jgi:hypothetical protein
LPMRATGANDEDYDDPDYDPDDYDDMEDET